MGSSEPLAIRYQTVQGLTERVLSVAESLSLAFDRWNDTYLRGPSLYQRDARGGEWRPTE